jgi:sugar phosphate isomerase/epimerase
VVHIKDFVPAGADLKSVAAGEGEMDYTAILRFIKARKPYIQATLENTANHNAVQSRQLIQRLYDEI